MYDAVRYKPRLTRHDVDEAEGEPKGKAGTQITHPIGTALFYR